MLDIGWKRYIIKDVTVFYGFLFADKYPLFYETAEPVTRIGKRRMAGICLQKRNDNGKV